MRKNFYLDPRGNSVVNRTWIPRYRRTVIGWDKHCRGRVINSREWNELPYKRNMQRLRHYFLIITSLNYLLFLLLLMFFYCCCCCFFFWFQMFVFRLTSDKYYLKLIILSGWTANFFIYIWNIFFCARILTFLVPL